MEVYIEVVILNNLAIDLALIMLTRFILKLKGHKARVIAASVLGAAAGAVYPLIPAPYKIIVNIALVPVLALIFAKYDNVKSYIFAALLFALLTFALGGIALAVLNLAGVDLVSMWVTGVVFLSLGFLAYMTRQLILYKKSGKKLDIIDASMVLYGEKIDISALYDSGNQLLDMPSGKPVVVLSRRIGERFLKNSTRRISVKTVGGSVELPLLQAEKLAVKPHEKEIDVVNFIVAVANENYNGFDLILHESFYDICGGI
jgi:ABC-type multidrug transport system fused ATPase/permease subunit